MSITMHHHLYQVGKLIFVYLAASLSPYRVATPIVGWEKTAIFVKNFSSVSSHVCFLICIHTVLDGHTRL